MLDKEAKIEVDQAVEEAKQSPEPEPKDLWTDIYYKGTEPSFMRGREKEEVRLFAQAFCRYVTNAMCCLDPPLLIEFILALSLYMAILC